MEEGEVGMEIPADGVEEGPPPSGMGINDLPDEILEMIFTRLSPYGDLDAIKSVCKHWNKVAKGVVRILSNNFHQAVHSGNLECVRSSATFNEHGRLVGFWILERFGQMCSIHDKTIYIVGGTTAAKTTFNDMWSLNLTTRQWQRVVPKGVYPSPKALGTLVHHKGNLVLFGGWAHPSPYPFMQPWRIFDELHLYNVEENRWTSIVEVSEDGPPPSAGHSATVHADTMVVFGGRTFDQARQSYPISNVVWIFDFNIGEWQKLKTSDELCPSPRYGQTQIALDDKHLLVIGGCGGPNQIFSDVWLLEMSQGVGGRYLGSWKQMMVTDGEKSIPFDFHYSGCKVGDVVVFFERSSPVSPFLAFLHFGAQAPAPPELGGVVFEDDRGGFNARCPTGLRTPITNPTMAMYILDISKVLAEGTVRWEKEPEHPGISRPNERLLYSMVAGRAEIILFGGFFKEPNGNRCRVTSDLFFLNAGRKTY